MSPGYGLYRRLSDLLDTEEEKDTAKQTKEREAAERKTLLRRRRRRKWPNPERAVPA